MGNDSTLINNFKTQLNNCCNNYYEVPYKERPYYLKKYVRREFELFYEYLSKAENKPNEIENIFKAHQEAEKKIYNYSKETGFCCTCCGCIFYFCFFVLFYLFVVYLNC